MWLSGATSVYTWASLGLMPISSRMQHVLHSICPVPCCTGTDSNKVLMTCASSGGLSFMGNDQLALPLGRLRGPS